MKRTGFKKICFEWQLSLLIVKPLQKNDVYNEEYIFSVFELKEFIVLGT